MPVLSQACGPFKTRAVGPPKENNCENFARNFNKSRHGLNVCHICWALALSCWGSLQKQIPSPLGGKCCLIPILQMGAGQVQHQVLRITGLHLTPRCEVHTSQLLTSRQECQHECYTPHRPSRGILPFPHLLDKGTGAQSNNVSKFSGPARGRFGSQTETWVLAAAMSLRWDPRQGQARVTLQGGAASIHRRHTR